MSELIRLYGQDEARAIIVGTRTEVGGVIGAVQGGSADSRADLYRVDCNQNPVDCRALGLNSLAKADKSHRCNAIFERGTVLAAPGTVVFCGKLDVYQNAAQTVQRGVAPILQPA